MLLILIAIAAIVAITLWLQRQEPQAKNQEFEVEFINNKTIHFPKDVKTYAKHPFAPDFSFISGFDYESCTDEPFGNHMETLYFYDYLKMLKLFKDNNDNNLTVKYIRLLKECGYEYQGNIPLIFGEQTINFNTMYFEEAQTRIQLGTDNETNTFIVIVRSPINN